MVLAALTNTPEPIIWTYTLGQLVARARRIVDIMPIVQPFPFALGGTTMSGGGDGTQDANASPQSIFAMARTMGIMVED